MMPAGYQCEYCGAVSDTDIDNPVKPRRFSPYDREEDRTVLCQECWRGVMHIYVRPKP